MPRLSWRQSARAVEYRAPKEGGCPAFRGECPRLTWARAHIRKESAFDVLCAQTAFASKWTWRPLRRPRNLSDIPAHCCLWFAPLRHGKNNKCVVCC